MIANTPIWAEGLIARVLPSIEKVKTSIEQNDDLCRVEVTLFALPSHSVGVVLGILVL